MSIYITGTNNKCGKTVVSAGIAAVMQSLGYRSCVYKPVETGAVNRGPFLESPDLAYIKTVDPYITVHSTYMFEDDGLPAECAEAENSRISLPKINEDYKILKKQNEVMLVEAPGGLMTPLFDKVYAHSLPTLLEIPVLFIAEPVKGGINLLLNEINTAKIAGIDIKGVIVNKMPSEPDSKDVIKFPGLVEKYSDVKVLGILRETENPPGAVSLISEFLNGIDLQTVLNMEIPKLKS